MSKSGRARKHDEKMKQRRAAKAAKKAKYQALAGTSRRQKRQKRTSGPTRFKGAHAMSNCGNVGCTRCFPQFAPRKKVSA